MPDVVVDVEVLRQQVRDKYRHVAMDPGGEHHFHTGRRLAALLGYDAAIVEALPDRAVESFAGSATRSRCGALVPLSTWSTSVPEQASTALSPRARSPNTVTSSAWT